MSTHARRRVTAIRGARTAPRQASNVAKRVLIILVLSLIAVSGGAAAAGVVYINGIRLPQTNPSDFIGFQNSQILTNNRHLLFETVSRQTNTGSKVLKPLELNPNNRKQCPHGKHTRLKRFLYKFGRSRVPYLTCNGWGIPAKLADATIATEDPTFYSNPGFDWLSILRAAYQNVSSGRIQSGASTIPQQLAKLYILHNTAPTIDRKLKEIILAYRLTQKYPKKFILYLYLNSVYYGDLAYGVQAAAESYFHVDVSQLKLWQAAMIAGLPQAPVEFDPFNSSSLSSSSQYAPWYTRMLEVLSFLNSRGYISQKREAQAERQAAKYRFRQSSFRIRQPAFVSYVTGQLAAMTNPDSPRNVYDPYLAAHLNGRSLNSGLKIVSTLRPRLQADAQRQVTAHVAALGDAGLGVTDGALVSINVRPGCYGCIMAMVGTANYDPATRLINMANSPRQPGSSFKVFNYVSAFEKGLSPSSVIVDGPVNIPDTSSPTGYYSPTNYDLAYKGQVNLRFALDNSLNVPAVKVELWNGARTVANTAFKFGITDFWKDNPNCCGWATTLGGLEGGVRLVQQTQAYGAFATAGIRVPAISFTKIVDRSTGKVLWRLNHDTWLKSRRKRVAPAADTYMVSSILSDNVTRAPDFGEFSPLNLYPYTAAAKTGTTSDFKDNWTMGYTPQIVTGVWVGNANDQAMGLGVNGITGAAPIWHDFMIDAFSILRLDNLPFTQPPAMVVTSVCQNMPYSTSIATPGNFGADPAGYPIGRTPLCQVPAVLGLDSPAYSTGPITHPTTGPAPAPIPIPTTPPPPPPSGPGLLP